MAKATLFLIHHDEDEARARAQSLVGMGYEVETDASGEMTVIDHVKDVKPDAVLLYLDYQPEQGREIAAALKANTATEPIPLVIVGGADEEIREAKKKITQAIYTHGENLVRILRTVFEGTEPELGEELKHGGKPEED